MSAAPIRTLVVEDEPLARRALRRFIDDTPRLELVGEAVDGAAALAFVEREPPELIFLDVKLPGISGPEVLARSKYAGVVIFTTAYDDYALIAFELGAIDYLRKPFGRDRIARALERAVPQVEARRAQAAMNAPVSERYAFATSVARPIDTIYVRDRGTVLPIPTREIVRVEADGDFVAVFARERRYLVYMNLGDLAGQLDPERFLRVHRSHIVNLAAVASLANYDANRVEVKLRDGSAVVASRVGTRALRQRIRQQPTSR